jgi:hypothetical protein
MASGDFTVSVVPATSATNETFVPADITDATRRAREAQTTALAAHPLILQAWINETAPAGAVIEHVIERGSRLVFIFREA